MSDTKNIPNNPIIGYTIIMSGKDKNIEIKQAEGRPSGEPSIPVEIPIIHNTITNETPDGKTVVTDKRGNVVGILDNDGRIIRKLNEEDRNAPNRNIKDIKDGESR